MAVIEILWLDDERNPMEEKWMSLALAPLAEIYGDKYGRMGYDVPNITWVKSYREFVDRITLLGEISMPRLICFDHDLGGFMYSEEIHPMNEDGTAPEEHKILYDKFAEDEKTGYHAAKWLCDYCQERKIPFPKYIIQSANTVGAKNIDSYIQNYLKHVEKNT